MASAYSRAVRELELHSEQAAKAPKQERREIDAARERLIDGSGCVLSEAADS